MAEKTEETKRADEGATGNIDKVLMALDAVCGRLDSFEKRFDSLEKGRMDAAEDDEKGMDPEDQPEDGEAKELAADKKGRKDAAEDEDEKAEKSEKKDARKDAAEDEDEKKGERKDAAEDDEKMDRKDSTGRVDRLLNRHTNAEIRRLSAAVANMPKSMTDADYAAMADFQARADSAYSGFGERAPSPLQGETPKAFRIRLAKGLQAHSAPWSGVTLRELPESALSIAEGQIYADAVAAARNPVGVPAGQLRAIVKHDGAGRKITEFVGDPSAWMGEFRTAPRALAKPFFRPRAN